MLENAAIKRRVIHSKPEFMKLISDDKIIEIISDKNHHPILKILKKEPMTVKELEVAYEEETGKKKSNKTIYRYLKTLEDNGLVMSAGQLVITGKTATESIYARTARAFFLIGKGKSCYEGAKGDKVAQGIGFILSPLYDNKKANSEKLKQIIQEYEDTQLKQIEKFSENVGDEILDIIEDVDFKVIQQILEFSTLFAGLKANPGLMDRVEACFK